MKLDLLTDGKISLRHRIECSNLLIEDSSLTQKGFNMSISPEGLRSFLRDHNLTQAQFAQLMDVSVGAVAQWLSAARGIPGPVEAYLNLLLRLPPSLQENELSRVQKEKPMIYGMYLIQFAGTAGSGLATLTFDDGRVYGFDEAGGEYDGVVRPSATPGVADVVIDVKMKAHQHTVAGGFSQPFDWSMQVSTSIPVNSKQGNVVVSTNVGQSLSASYKFMRALPKVA